MKHSLLIAIVLISLAGLALAQPCEIQRHVTLPGTSAL